MHKHKRICLICIITVGIAASLEASAPGIAWEGSELPLGGFILILGDENPEAQQSAAAVIKKMKVSGDQILLTWAKLGRLLSRGGIINYDIDHWLRVRDAVFRISSDPDNTSAGLQNTLKSDESALALDVLVLNSTIIQLGDEYPQGQQQATAAIKEMKISDSQILLAWATLTRLFHVGGLIDYNFDHWLRMRDAVFRFINLDKALVGLLDTLKSGNKDESILARYVIDDINDQLSESSIKPLPGTLPLLTESLKDPDAEIREAATQLLETISTHAKDE